MKKIRCIAVDDEPLALDILKVYISKIPSLELVALCGNALEALSLIQQDKVFLDIQMPDLTGMQFLRIINGKCKAILTTAYPQYALEGYEYEVIDYLLKPISFERFLKAVQKASLQFPNLVESEKLVEEDLKITPSVNIISQNIPDFIFVKVEHKMLKVNLLDILYIEGLKDYCSIYTKTERILTLQTMKKMEENLPQNRFTRVHKSYIVALDKIESVERQRITIEKYTIPVGDSFKDDFMKVLGG
jgi:two-component system, LytTR family, response regulator